MPLERDGLRPTVAAAARGGQANARSEPLFAGPETLRVLGERRTFWICLLAAPLAIGLIGLAFPSVSISEFILLVVVAMLFVSLGRGRLLGSSIRIDGRQMPEIQKVVHEVAARLDIAVPQIFIRDDFFTPIAAIGLGEPYALILSSQYIEHLQPGELAFLIARELGHIAAGHTRITSLLSTSGRENPVVAIVLGPWLRKTEYTADRVGLLCSGGIDDAVGAVAITTFHSIGRRVDMRVLEEQRREFDAEPTLRMGEWIAGMPYATNRLHALRVFEQSALAAAWRKRLLPSGRAMAPRPSTSVRDAVGRDDCAGFWSRTAAFVLDLIIIAAIVKSPLVLGMHHGSVKELASIPAPLRGIVEHLPAFVIGLSTMVALLTYFVYSAVFVGISGQTLGMMILDLRVVTTRFVHPSPARALWRYVLAFGSVFSAFALLGFFFRVHPHDRLSRTRVVAQARARTVAR